MCSGVSTTRIWLNDSTSSVCLLHVFTTSAAAARALGSTKVQLLPRLAPAREVPDRAVDGAREVAATDRAVDRVLLSLLDGCCRHGALLVDAALLVDLLVDGLDGLIQYPSSSLYGAVRGLCVTIPDLDRRAGGFGCFGTAGLRSSRRG